MIFELIQDSDSDKFNTDIRGEVMNFSKYSFHCFLIAHIWVVSILNIILHEILRYLEKSGLFIIKQNKENMQTIALDFLIKNRNI